MSTPTTSRRPARMVAVAAAAGFAAIAAFEAALALGAPLGRAAWGGTYTYLPTGLRIASAAAVAVWLFAAVIVLGRAGWRVIPLPAGFLRAGTWSLVGLQVLAALANVASSSNWERFVWGPVALTMAALCLVVARSRRPTPAATSEETSIAGQELTRAPR